MTNADRLDVLMVGDRLEQRGGIATLQRVHLASAPPNVHTTHIGTHDEGSYLYRVLLFLRALVRVALELRTDRFDLVHVHQSGGGSLVRKAFILRLASRRDVPVVLHGHAGWSDSTLDAMPRPLAAFVTSSLRRASAVIALSSEWAEWYRDRIGVDPERVFVVHNPAPPRTPLVGDYRRDGPVRIVSVSRLRPEKGTYDLLTAFAGLPPKMRAGCELVLAGDGELHATREFAEHLGVSDQVVLPGWLEGRALHELMASADVFVSASHHEGMPLSVLEAMSCGVATVSTAVGGVPEIIEDGRNGILLEPGSPLALTHALMRLVTNPELRATLGHHALESCATNDVDAYWDRVGQVYQVARGSGAAVASPSMQSVGEPRLGVSVVVPSFNRAPWLAEALESLAQQSIQHRVPVEVIVVDNASTDDTATEVGRAAGKFTNVHIRYEYERTPGDGAARNRGLVAATHDTIVFFDDDQIADPQWIENLVRVADATGANIVGGSVGLLLDEPDRFGPVTRRDMLRELRPYTEIRPYDDDLLPGTCNLLVDRKVFDTIGDFDATLNGGSDFDFLRRARRSGFELWHAPAALVHHRVGEYRRTDEYFRRESRRNGWGLAETTRVERGTLPMVGECLARLGQALLVNLPLLVLARVRRDGADAVDRKVLLWRAEGFMRRTVAKLLPHVWPQGDFVETHQFAGHESQQVARERAGRKAS